MDKLNKLLESVDIELSLAETLTELFEIEQQAIATVETFKFPVLSSEEA